MAGVRRAALLLLVLAACHPAWGQSRFQTLGPNECLNCHDHQAERQWYERQELQEVRKLFPEMGANAGHINSLKQLEAPKSNDFARAVGLKDKYDVGGACVKCHATVFQGDANAGVSCESCHGAASGYLKAHQEKGDPGYQAALKVGMTPLVGDMNRWAQQCTSCHVMDDARLIEAGHPKGDDFDLGTKYAPVALHFKKKYDVARLSAIGRSQVEALVRKRGGAAAPAPAAASAPAAPVTVTAPPVLPPPPAPVAAASPVVVAPLVQTAPAQPGAPPVPPSAGLAPRTAVAAPAAAASSAGPAPAAPAPPSYTSQPAAAAVASLSDAVAYVQGRIVQALSQLLQSGTSAPVRSSTPPGPLPPYSGPDAALLQIQREAIALALEALGTPPAGAAGSTTSK
jgi:hypothetical protein